MAKVNAHQYQLDIEGSTRQGLAGQPEPGWEEHTYDEGGAHLGMHDDNLFDQKGTADGQLIDPSTGEPYSDNIALDPLEELVEVTRNGSNGDVLPKILEKRDAAAIWLAEHETSAKVADIRTFSDEKPASQAKKAEKPNKKSAAA